MKGKGLPAYFVQPTQMHKECSLATLDCYGNFFFSCERPSKPLRNFIFALERPSEQRKNSFSRWNDPQNHREILFSRWNDPVAAKRLRKQ